MIWDLLEKVWILFKFGAAQINTYLTLTVKLKKRGNYSPKMQMKKLFISLAYLKKSILPLLL